MVQKVNVTLDDFSPLIEYSPSGAWIDGTTADPFWQAYDNNGTFTLTTVYGATASLTFNGTTIWIYGSKRANHGPYNITLDGEVFTDDGFYDGELFQQVLFSAVGLDGAKPHTVSITNSLVEDARPYLDVDSIVYQMEIPDDYQELKQQDTLTAFQYSSSGWDTNPEDLANYDSNTGHATSLGDAYVDYTFEGTHVGLYGVVGPSGGPYTVQLDNGLPRTLNASRDKISPRTILYQDTGLSPGKHTMRIANAPFSGQTLSIDYAVVWGPSNNTSTDGASPSSSSSLSGAVIGGVVAGGCGLVIIVLVGLFFWYRRRHRRPAVLPQEVLRAEFTSDDSHESVAESSTTHLTPFLHSTITRYPASTAAPPPLPSSVHDLPGQVDPSLHRTVYQPESGQSLGSRLAVRNGDHPVVSSRSSFEAVDEKMHLAMRERDPQVSVVSQPAGLFNVATSEDLRNARMQVEGRVQDFGPVTYVSGNNEDLLPPDYNQATEPFRAERR